MPVAVAPGEVPAAAGPVRHARDLPAVRRIAAYLIMLGGYFFYCYNFLVLD